MHETKTSPDPYLTRQSIELPSWSSRPLLPMHPKHKVAPFRRPPDPPPDGASTTDNARRARRGVYRTRGVGADVTTLEALTSAGRVMLRIDVDHDLVGDEEMAKLEDWLWRKLDQKDPAVRLRAI